MGLKVALKLFDHAKGIIGIEDNKPEAIRIMKEKTANEPDIEVKELKTKYPQGGERCLIYATTGRSINSSMLPADAGCIVHNVDTIFSIYMAVIEGKPLTKRIVTVTGDGQLLCMARNQLQTAFRSGRRSGGRTGEVHFRRPDDGICNVQLRRSGCKGKRFTFSI